MSLPLMDTSDEDIACVLYDAFDFMLGNERRECVWEKNINRREKEEEDDEEEKDDDEEVGVSCTVKWAVRVRSLFASRLSCGEKV